MGLTADSTGRGAIDLGSIIQKEKKTDRIIALAGNPNVGKSTVFNELTGLNQHTGNWPGKTVTTAQGRHTHKEKDYILVDLPGTYSLMAHSAEEEVARDFICFGKADAVVVVCDATCLERNLNLVLQTIEITKNVVVCINLMDEANKKNISIDLKKLEKSLGVPVVGTSARSGKGLYELMNRVAEICDHPNQQSIDIHYLKPIESAISLVEPIVSEKISPIFNCPGLNSRWISLKLIDYDEVLIKSIEKHLKVNILEDQNIAAILLEAQAQLHENGILKEKLNDNITSCLVLTAEGICNDSVCASPYCSIRDRKLDKILMGKWTGVPIMILLLCIVFWLTITGANYPSQLLSDFFFWIQDHLTNFVRFLGAPEWVNGLFIEGMYRTLAWVVSVMLPPMAIFFPLFTLLEDFGYLPRVAFNLDHHFKKACACGKQSLTMCMGFGCNAAGIVGCRIIDSPRERMIAILTNNFVPCNGRFPTLIAIICMFFTGMAAAPFQSVISTFLLLGIIVLGVFLTFSMSRLLSKTILKGLPSSFTLELPPYRCPQIGKVLVRSFLDRTLFVLARAVTVAAPAGIIIWLMANIYIGNANLLNLCSNFLDPFAKLLGLDGVILLAFILGFPANEIVVPIIIMAYLSTGSLTDYGSLSSLKTLLVDHGWTWVTAISTMLFCLMHWPCSTSCLTIKKETKSIKWTLIAFLLPTAVGMIVCFLFTSIVKLCGF